MFTVFLILQHSFPYFCHWDWFGSGINNLSPHPPKMQKYEQERSHSQTSFHTDCVRFVIPTKKRRASFLVSSWRQTGWNPRSASWCTPRSPWESWHLHNICTAYGAGCLLCGFNTFGNSCHQTSIRKKPDECTEFWAGSTQVFFIRCGKLTQSRRKSSKLLFGTVKAII